MTFAVGDVVELKSGSGPMTVTVIADDDVECHWWEPEKLRHKRFPKAALKASKAALSLEELALQYQRGTEASE